MPLHKKKTRNLTIEVPSEIKIEKSMSSPEISSEFQERKLAQRSESQRLRKKSWYQRLLNPFRRFRRNTMAGSFTPEYDTKFYTPLYSRADEILNLGKDDELDKASISADIEVDVKKEIVRNEPPRTSVRRTAPEPPQSIPPSKSPAPAPFNIAVLRELKESLNQRKPNDASDSPTPSTTPEGPIYENEINIGFNQASSRRRPSSTGIEIERRLSNLESIYEPTWLMTTLEKKNINDQTKVEENTRHETIQQMQVVSNLETYDSVDFNTSVKQEPHLESLFSKFPKPKPPKRTPSRRQSKPEDFLRETISEVRDNEKSKIIHRRSNVELEEVIMKLSEIPAPEAEPKGPPKPKRRTKFDSLPNLLDDSPLYANFDSLNKDKIKPVDALFEKADQLMDELNNDWKNNKSKKPQPSPKPDNLLARNNSFPRIKSNPSNGKTPTNAESNIDENNENTNGFKRTKTLPSKYSWQSHSSTLEKKSREYRKELRTNSESKEWIETESTMTQDSCTQTSQSSLANDLTEHIYDLPIKPIDIKDFGEDLEQLESKVKELLNDKSMEKSMNRNTPPNTPEQQELYESLSNTLQNERIDVKAEVNLDDTSDPNKKVVRTFETIKTGDGGEMMIETKMVETKSIIGSSNQDEFHIGDKWNRNRTESFNEDLHSELNNGEKWSTIHSDFEPHAGTTNENATERKIFETIKDGKKITTEIIRSGGKSEIITTEIISFTGNVDPKEILEKKFGETFPNVDFGDLINSPNKDSYQENKSSYLIQEKTIEDENSEVLYDIPDEQIKGNSFLVTQKPSKPQRIKKKPATAPKPTIASKQDEFVRRGALRRKSNSTSEDPNSPTKSLPTDPISEYQNADFAKVKQKIDFDIN